MQDLHNAPPLATRHRGPWAVIPIGELTSDRRGLPIIAPGDFAKPFRWLYDALLTR